MVEAGIESTSGVNRHLGIRFAAPPVGDRRWRPPSYVAGAEPLGTWGPDCPQPVGLGGTRAETQDEDCLFLNVWTPTTDPDAGLPVLVWFYGGSFVYGSASDPATDGAGLAARGAVVVTAGYRLGLFGFLAHPALTAESEAGSSGNYGLLDNLAALRWVRENIGRYGGDPTRITAFGVSAGSASLALLATSLLAQNAFDQLILQSPGAWRPLAGLDRAERVALDAYGPDIDAMRDWPPSEVMARSAAMVPAVRGLTTARLARPLRDGWIIAEDDRTSYRAGRFAAVPTIVGGSADEGGSLTAGWPIRTVVAYRQLLATNFGSDADDVFEQYPVGGDDDVVGAVAELFGDTQFNLGARGIAAAVSQRQSAIYRYLFSRRDSEGRPPGHGAEVAGLFDGTDPTGDAMAEAWVRFAATGDPNGGSLPRWDRYDPARDEYLDFGDDLATGRRWRGPQLDCLERWFQANRD